MKSACRIAAGLVAAVLAVVAIASPVPTPPASLTVNGNTVVTPPVTPPVVGSGGFLQGAYSQMSYQGLAIVPNGRYPTGGFDAFEGTDTVTGFVHPRTPAIWGGGTPQYTAQIQLIQDHEGDQTRQILQGGVLPAGSLPGSGRTESFYRNTMIAPYDPNCGGISGNTMQNQYILWPAGGNVGKMYYHRQWMRFSSNLATAMGGGSFFVVGENKTASSTWRTQIGINSYAGKGPQWSMTADGFPGGSYTPIWQDTFDPSVFPVPLNQWFLFEFATRPSAGSNGFAWVAINGHVMSSNFTYQQVAKAYVSGAHTGPTRPNDEDVNRIFLNMSYSDASRATPIMVDVARFEVWESFPSDATQPHP